MTVALGIYECERLRSKSLCRIEARIQLAGLSPRHQKVVLTALNSAYIPHRIIAGPGQIAKLLLEEAGVFHVWGVNSPRNHLHWTSRLPPPEGFREAVTALTEADCSA